MSTKTKLIIGSLFFVQIGIFAWSRFDYEANKSPFEEKLDTYLSNAENVKTLDFQGLNLTKLPEDILQFQNVEVINLSHNNFNKVPTILYELPNLKRLNLSYNQLTQVRLHKFESITDLDFSHNEIKYCSGQSYIQTLQNINLSHNQLSDFPSFRVDMDTINFSNNQLHNFIEIAYSISGEIQHINFSNNNFSNFNNVRLLLNSCHSLDLSNSRFAEDDIFPTSIFKEDVLMKKLFLNECAFKGIDSLSASDLEVLELGKSFIDIKNNALQNQQNLLQLNLENADLYDFNYSSTTLKELNLIGAFVYGNITLNLPNLEILHLSVTFDDIDLIDFPNLKTIHYHSNSDRFIDILQAKYPNANIIQYPVKAL